MFVTALIFGMMVLILSLQLWGGFPPIYRPSGKLPAAETRRLLPQLFLIFPAMAAFVVFKHPILLALMGAIGLWGGWRIRRVISNAGAAPRFVPSWPIFVRHPMLVFDLWTLGGAAALAALMLI